MTYRRRAVGPEAGLFHPRRPAWVLLRSYRVVGEAILPRTRTGPTPTRSSASVWFADGRVGGPRRPARTVGSGNGGWSRSRQLGNYGWSARPRRLRSAAALTCSSWVALTLALEDERVAGLVCSARLVEAASGGAVIERVTVRDGAGQARSAAGWSYLRCPRWGLGIQPRVSWLAIEHCPRCVAQARIAVRLVSSPLPTPQHYQDESPEAPGQAINTLQLRGYQIERVPVQRPNGRNATGYRLSLQASRPSSTSPNTRSRRLRSSPSSANGSQRVRDPGIVSLSFARCLLTR